MTLTCPFCHESILPADEQRRLDNGVAHRECLLRNVIGSVGHQQRQCSCHGVEDTSEVGLTRRQAAKAAMDYYHRETVRRSEDMEGLPIVYEKVDGEWRQALDGKPIQSDDPVEMKLGDVWICGRYAMQYPNSPPPLCIGLFLVGETSIGINATMRFRRTPREA